MYCVHVHKYTVDWYYVSWYIEVNVRNAMTLCDDREKFNKINVHIMLNGFSSITSAVRTWRGGFQSFTFVFRYNCNFLCANFLFVELIFRRQSRRRKKAKKPTTKVSNKSFHLQLFQLIPHAFVYFSLFYSLCCRLLLRFMYVLFLSFSL